MRIIFFGTPAFALPPLQTLSASRHQVVRVIAQPDKPAGRGLKLHSPPVVDFARSAGIETSQPARIRDDAFFDSVRACEADIGIVVAYGKILPEKLLTIPTHGFLNIHASLLPKYRGAAPIQRAIENGECVTGVTIMRVDAQLDHGPSLLQQSTAIDLDEHSPALAERLSWLGAETLIAALEALEKGMLSEEEQDHAQASFAPKIEKHEGLIRWDERAIVIYNRFRAFDPWPSVFFHLDGEPVKLIDISVMDQSGPAGAVLSADEGDVVVGTAAGAIRIMKVQQAGKGPVDAGQFFRARKLTSGARLS